MTPRQRPAPFADQLFAAYLRGHLLGASVGVRLAQRLAQDPWTNGQLDHMPEELSEEIRFVRRWAREYSALGETAINLSLIATGTASTTLALFAPTRRPVVRTVALEAMRTMVLAKKAMWEMGSSIVIDDDERTRSLERFDRRALHQATELHMLHVRSSAELFGRA
ncbi:MAG TPA: hypothetical protein K8V11_01020 [Dietzia timorensis]|uniref:Uncharacterized protein n=1 Tax=Dietzia timorensis TaxID=499555 RepID=A0A921F1D8_9ACTN|nr:hypothetical protein [Dietzia timorensis]HJE89575.1 hypothetical protein [Dietzia timorensis]